MMGRFISRGWVLLWLCAAGCSTVADVALETAAQDLRCPKNEVRTTREGTFLSSPSHFFATGCGHYIKYLCYPVGKANYKCFPDQPPQIQPRRERGLTRSSDQTGRHQTRGPLSPGSSGPLANIVLR